jgi:transposase
MEPGMSASLVAQEAGVTASQLFQWRKAYTEGSLVAVGANEPVVPASDLQDAMKRIKQLEAALGRKTLENDILKEAVDFAKAKKWIARSGLRVRRYCPGTTDETGVFHPWRGAQSSRGTAETA